VRKDTKLVEAGRSAGPGASPVNPVVQRASTIVFPTLDAYEAAGRNKYSTLRYGRHGTSTVFALQDAMAEIEGGFRAIALPSGVAAISATLMALAGPGSHLLVSDAVYGATRSFCDGHLRQIGVAVTYYDPAIGAGIEALFRPETVAVYCESPGTATFEMQDIPAIAAVAHRRGALVVHDNTWATPYFFPSFERGVDVSIHAATKYIVGHSDAMMGVIVCTEDAWSRIRPVTAELGYAVSADDAYLALRGLRTLAVRLVRHQSTAMAVTRFLTDHPRVTRVLYPALAGDPGHAVWKRDFTGASGLFGLRVDASRQAVRDMADGLRLFGIGSSWGGYESLVTLPQPARSVGNAADAAHPEGILVRLHVGLEDPADLIEDLARNLDAMPR